MRQGPKQGLRTRLKTKKYKVLYIQGRREAEGTVRRAEGSKEGRR